MKLYHAGQECDAWYDCDASMLEQFGAAIAYAKKIDRQGENENGPA